MASNQVGSGTEADTQPVQVLLAFQPTIFRIHGYLLDFQFVGHLESLYAGTLELRIRKRRGNASGVIVYVVSKGHYVILTGG